MSACTRPLVRAQTGLAAGLLALLVPVVLASTAQAHTPAHIVPPSHVHSANHAYPDGACGWD